MSEADTLELLEHRLQKLELKMFGSASKDADYPEILSTLTDLSTSLGTVVGSREKIAAVIKRLEELDQYLDPCYGMAPQHLPEGALIDLLLCQEDHWQQQLQKLQQLVQLRHVLDSEPIRDCVNHGDKLVELTIKQSELEDLNREQAERVTRLLDTYNSIINTLTETFVRMDEIVTRAEIATQHKKDSE